MLYSSGYVSEQKTTNEMPVPVLGFPYDITDSSFVIAWSDFTEHGITQYKFDLSVEEDFDTFVTGYNGKLVEDVLLSVTGLDDDVTYYCRVRAVYEIFESDNSSTGNVTTLKRYGIYSTAEIDILVNSPNNYIPVCTATELYNIRTASNNTFGAGTKWQGTYLGGKDKKYVQLCDIDMYAATREGGAYWNSGAGWNNANAGFSANAIYDGAGHIIDGIYVNRPTTAYAGGFWYNIEGNGVEIKNLGITNLNTNSGGGGYTGAFLNLTSKYNAKISNCFSSGIVIGTAVGGFISYNETLEGAGGGYIKNCAAFVVVVSKTGTYASAFECINNIGMTNSCYATGLVLNATPVPNNSGFCGYKAAGGYHNYCYWDKTTTNNTYVSGNAVGKTTTEMLALVDNNYDTNVWQFAENRYPILKMFSHRAEFCPPVQGFTVDTTDFDTDGVLDFYWTDYNTSWGLTPDSYEIIILRLDMVTLAYDLTIVADLTGTHYTWNPNPVPVGAYTFVIKAVFD